MMPSLTWRSAIGAAVPRGPEIRRKRKKDWPTTDFIVQRRIPRTLEEMPLPSARYRVSHSGLATRFLIDIGEK
jgi:hypothetical protein